MILSLGLVMGMASGEEGGRGYGRGCHQGYQGYLISSIALISFSFYFNSLLRIFLANISCFLTRAFRYLQDVPMPGS
jgi:hypothetical protein